MCACARRVFYFFEIKEKSGSDLMWDFAFILRLVCGSARSTGRAGKETRGRREARMLDERVQYAVSVETE